MPVEFKLPDLGEGIHEAEIIEVLVRPGDRVEDGQPVMIVETDKATTEVPAPVTGTVKEVRVKAGQTVKVGDVLMVFQKEGEAEETSKPATEPATKPAPAPVREEKPAAPPAEGPVAATPSTRRLARELNVDLRLVKPSGPGGRISPEDVLVYAAQMKEKTPPAIPARAPEEEKAQKPIQAPPSEPPPLPRFDELGPVERVPLRSVRRATAKHLALAWSQIPHVNHQDLADITDLEAFRLKHKDQVKDRGGALSLTVFMLKAAAITLKKYPGFNSSLDMEGGEIILKHYYNIGVAVDTDRGLIVPVIRNVDCKSIFELASELRELADRTRQGKPSREDLTGGTFTITNIGALGGTGFSPIVNYPEVAILGMGRGRIQPVAVGEEGSYTFVPRLMLPLILAFDHRVVDGADAARFVNSLIEVLKDPEELLMMV